MAANHVVCRLGIPPSHRNGILGGDGTIKWMSLMSLMLNMRWTTNNSHRDHWLQRSSWVGRITIWQKTQPAPTFCCSHYRDPHFETSCCRKLTHRPFFLSPKTNFRSPFMSAFFLQRKFYSRLLRPAETVDWSLIKHFERFGLNPKVCVHPPEPAAPLSSLVPYSWCPDYWW